MNKAVVRVQPGICGLATEIRAESEDSQNVVLVITSACPDIEAMAAEIVELDGYAVAFGKFSESPVYQAAERHFRHAACPVPMAVVKAVEVACGLALPKDVAVTVERG